MELECRYNDEQLERVVDQAVIYQCACPAQVAHLLMALHEVHQYQRNCLSRDDDKLVQTHEKIAKATELAHQLLEDCFEEVVELEGWDKQTLRMPEYLRSMQRKELDRWLNR
jgi:hypothetical protein